ncbi:MAG: hypothetical protein ACI9F9_002376 [Candidatus Paceibacteria bacterium]|jgi:hypothetical protein
MTNHSRLKHGAYSLAFGALALSFGSQALAQSTLFAIDGTAANDRLGQDIDSVGDYDGDGVLDFVVGAPQDGAIFGGGDGYARIYSGVDGTALATMTGGAGQEAFGTTVAGIGDLDGDGIQEIAVGAPYFDGPGLQRGRVVIFDGLTRSVLFTFVGDLDGDRMGTIVAGVGDINNDGTPDLAASAFGSDVTSSNSGTVRVFSGFNGSTLHSFEGSGPNSHLGVSIIPVGDFDGDGFDDLCVGALIGPVEIYSGQTGGLLQSFPSPGANDAFGSGVAYLGDLTGDGTSEFLIGAPQNSVFSNAAGYARVLDGTTGATIVEFLGDVVGDEFGYSVESAGDFNGDGIVDYIVGAPASQDTGRLGYARVFSGANGAILKVFTAESGTSRLGFKLRLLGDINGDGTTEFAVAEPDSDTPGIRSGQLTVETGVAAICPTPVNYCVSLPNTTGQVAAISYTGTNFFTNNDLVLQASNCPPGQFGLFFYGPSRAFAVFGSGIRCVGGGLFRLQPALTIDPAGFASRAIDTSLMAGTSGAINAGDTWDFQFWFRDPNDGNGLQNLTDGLEVIFCP